MAVPKLRFKREDGSEYPEWTAAAIEDITEKQSLPVKVNPKEEYREIGIRSHGKGLFYKEPVLGKELGNKRVFEVVPDCLIVNIVFAWERAVARTTENEIGMIASHRFPMYKPKEDILDLDYMVRYLITDRGKLLLELASPGGAGRNRTLGQKEFAKSRLPLPCIEEQRKIATFLVELDNMISACQDEIDNLEQQKKAVMRRIFSQEIRFKREDGTEFPDWEERALSYCFEIRNIKQVPTPEAPLMAFIAYKGVAYKGDKYDRSYLIKTEDKKYKRTEFNDFIYSSNNLDVGSIGLNKFGTAVISVVYEIFKVNETTVPDFINALVQTSENMNKIIQFRQGCLYGQYKINANDFLSVKTNIPCLEEQQKIADFLSEYDTAIQAAKEELEKWQELKKGLLQQMFV